MQPQSHSQHLIIATRDRDRMESIIRANKESLRSLKIGGHRTYTATVETNTEPTASQALNLVRLEEYVNKTKPLRKGWVLPLFVLIGLGLNMPFAALNGAIVYFTKMFGPSYYLHFLAAFNIPAIPLLTAQLLLDENLDKKFGSKITFSVRLITTFSIMCAATFLLPYFVSSFLYVIIIISVIGIANGIAFGSIFQLASIFSNKGTACVFAGLGIGNLFTTLTLIGLHFDDRAAYNMEIVHKFFQIHGSMVGVGILAIILVMMSAPATTVLAEKDRVSRRYDPEYAPLISVNKDEARSSMLGKLGWKTNLTVLAKTWKSQMSMFLTFFTGVTITTFVAYLPSVHRWQNDGLFVLLALYINIYGDFFGKNLTFFKSPIKSDLTLLLLSIVRSGYLVYFFLYITVPDFPKNDYVILGTIGVVALLGGYLTNLMFTIAPTTAPSEYTQQVATMVTLVLHLAVYSSIGTSFALTRYVNFMVKDI
jgi:MFS family permease